MAVPVNEPNEEDRLELPEDNQAPFQSAAAGHDDSDQPDGSGQTVPGQLDDTHPVTDTDIDPQELYDEGISGAARASEPNAGNNVIGYNPPAKPGQDQDPDGNS